MSVTNIINERNVSNNGSDLDVFGNNQTVDVITNTVNERVELEERLGDEIIDNGDFPVDSNWSKGDGWSIGNGVASCDGTQTGNSNLVGDTGVATVGKTFKISYTVSNHSSGLAFISMGGYNYLAQDIDSNGEFTQILTVSNASSNTKFYVTANSTFVGSVDNISVKQVSFNREAFTNETDQHNSTVTNIVNERTV